MLLKTQNNTKKNVDFKIIDIMKNESKQGIDKNDSVADISQLIEIN